MLYSAPSLSLLGFLDHAQARPAWRRVGAAQCRVGDAEWDVVDGGSGVEWVPSFPSLLSRCRQEQSRLFFSPVPLVSPESSISMPSGVFANQ